MRAWSIIAALALALSGCEGERPEPSTPKAGPPPLSVYVVNEPLRSFADRIGGDVVEVSFPAPRDVDPASWSPTPDVVAAYQGADLVLLQGADYAAWVGRASLHSSRLVDTSAGFADRLLPRAERVQHVHGPEGEHAHGGAAVGSWLDPTLAAVQARAVADALARARPEHAAEFEQRFESLAAELGALDERLAGVTGAWGTRPLLFSHPVYPYFQRRYELDARSLTWEPDESPGEPEWQALERLLAEHPAGWMLWEAEPAAATARRLEELGVGSAVFDPCANIPETGDFLSVMNDNAARLEAALGGG
jgi:zinc transport system substrate-binding protein